MEVMRSFKEYWNEHGDVYAMDVAENAWDYQQSKVDELQAKFDQHDQWLGQRNKDVQELYDIIVKHAAEKGELQKRVDAVKTLIEEYRDPSTEDKTFQHALSIVANELEQALKGGEA